MSLSQFKSKIEKEMRQQGLNPTSLSVSAGLGKTAVRDLLRNPRQDPGIETIFKIVKALDKDLEWLFCDTTTMIGSRSVIVPELNVRVSAGHGAMNDAEETTNTWAIPRSQLEAMQYSKLEFLKIIQVQGDSMLPDYRPGDRILVDTSDRIPSDGAYVLVDDFHNLLVKKLQVVRGSKPTRVKVISTNKDYDSYELKAEDIVINGKVIGKWDWR